MTQQHGITTRSERLLPLPEAAARLSISLRTLRSLIAAGKIQVIEVSARRKAIDPADLDRFIDEQRR